MKIDKTSFYRNSEILNATATSPWGSSIGQSSTRNCRIDFDKAGVLEIIVGMTYKAITDPENVDISSGSYSREKVLCAKFDKVYLNDELLQGCSYLLCIVKEHSKSHDNRLILSYANYITYKGQTINKDTIDTIQNKLCKTVKGAWFIYDLSIANQDELKLSAIVLDDTNDITYHSTEERSASWDALINQQNDKAISYNDDLLSQILARDYNSAPQNMKVAAIHSFGIQYGNYIKNASEVIRLSGLNSSYSTELSKGINIYKTTRDKIFGLSFGNLENTLINIARNTNKKSDISDFSKLPLQTIFYGAPGTGKSHKIDGQTNDDNSIRTTFHPDTDYATFVGAYKPMMEETEVRVVPVVLNNGASFDQNNGTYKEKRIVYKYEPQVFLKAYVEAWKKWLGDDEDKKYYLVIEEINRGNCAQIFGDLFQLLDREDSGYSSYAISPESSITKYLSEEAQSADGTKFSDLGFSDVTKYRDGVEKVVATADDLKAGKRLVLPPNLHIWATMNTSDQSLFPIDSAFKRRWDWEYVPIKRADKEPENKWTIRVTHDGKTYWCYWWEFLEAINHQIEETTHSEDKQLGYFFAKPKNGEDFISTDTFVNKVIFYLWNDVFKDEDSAVFQYDNDKVEDVSINRSGTMYFRHFMENKDEMIHYFINQLFAMGKENNPVVPIDYLKNDADSKVIEHLPKMRVLEEEAPASEEIPNENADDDDGKAQRNTDKYIVDGAEEQIKKKQLLEKIVRKQIEKNPSITIEELKDSWKDLSLNSQPCILADDEYQKLISEKPSYQDRYNQIEWKEIWVNNQIGGADTASRIIEKAKSQGISVEIVKK